MKAECLNIGDYFRYTDPRAYPGVMFCVVNIHPEKTSLSGSSPLIEVVDQYNVTHWFPKETVIDKMETTENGRGIVNRVVMSSKYEVLQLLHPLLNYSGNFQMDFQVELRALGVDEPLFNFQVRTELEARLCAKAVRTTVLSILKHSQSLRTE